MVTDELGNALGQYLGVDASDIMFQVAAGGDIHQALIAQSPQATVFVKTNSKRYAQVLKAEYASLCELQALGQQQYPHALFYRAAAAPMLVMSYHDLVPLDRAGYAQLGESLALQHQHSSQHFGWPTDNYIGLTHQANPWMKSWPDFFRTARLKPQLALATGNGLAEALVTAVQCVIDSLGVVLANSGIRPALLHGDLWNGNVAFDRSRVQAMMYDPAPYFGDPEVDIAMTELFSGFSVEFYTAYHAVLPRRLGYERRKKVYNLYHALNHFNLFGAQYESMVERHCG